MKIHSLIPLFLSVFLLTSCHISGIPNLPLLPEPEDHPPPATVIDSTNVPNASRAERIEWLQNNVCTLRSILPDDDDYSDLEPLRQYIGESRIVILGEQTPWDGVTQLAKTRLVKFLNQVMGFEVLAFESGIYDTWKAWQDIDQGKDVKASFRAAMPVQWGYSREMEGLIDYIEQNTYSPLTLLGIDCEFTGVYSLEFIYWDLNEFLNDIGINVQEYPEWAVFGGLLEKFANHQAGDIESEQQSVLFDITDRLKNDIRDRTSLNDPLAVLWYQVIESLETQAKREWSDWGITERIFPPHYWNVKSDQMARNLLAYADAIYPDKKIIVWAQSRHVCRRIHDEVTNSLGYLISDEMTSMTDMLWDILGADIYTLIFTAYQGSFKPYFWFEILIESAVTGDFEDLMNAAGFDLAFLDLRSLNDYRTPEVDRLLPANGAWFQNGLIMKSMEYNRMMARDWTHIIDGVIFTRDMTPSTRSPD